MLDNTYNGTKGDSPQYKGNWAADPTDTGERRSAANRFSQVHLNVPPKDLSALARLSTACDPQALIGYMADQFAATECACDHTLTKIRAYFAGSPQAECTVFQVLESLDARCDCEAFFLLRMLTR